MIVKSQYIPNTVGRNNYMPPCHPIALPDEVNQHFIDVECQHGNNSLLYHVYCFQDNGVRR